MIPVEEKPRLSACVKAISGQAAHISSAESHSYVVCLEAYAPTDRYIAGRP